MTKRGIDDLTFNTSASSSTTGTLLKTEGSSSTFDGDSQAKCVLNISNGVSTDYLNGGSTTSSSTSTNGSQIVTANDHSSNKKFKTDGSAPASGKSRVVHIRNIPSDTSSQELLFIASPFGNVTKHLFVRSKGQAFVEFDSHFSAMQMASYWIQTTIGGIPTQVQPTIRGRHVHVQVSNHKELKTNFENGSNGSLNTNGVVHDFSEFASSTDGTTTTPSPVIRLVIDNQVYPMSLDAIYQAFSRCGKVLKIITFNKNQQFQALIQFADITSAVQAKTSYDGQCTYPGSISVMHIEYSKQQNLIVKYNNDKSRDYTLLNGTASMNGLATEPHDLSSTLLAAAATIPTPTTAPFSNLNGHAASSLSAAAFNQRYFAAAALASGGLIPAAAAAASTNAAMFAATTGLGTNLVFTPVVHVSGLNAEHITPDALFTLFGVYGDVIRVKILFNKKDTALIQMAELSQAQNAISYLDRTRLYGKTMHVMSSKHQMVQMPKEGHQDSGLTKDYSNSSLHRFKRPGSKNYNNIYPPSETLHVSNIPSSCTEEDLRNAFRQETGKEIVKFKFFPNDHRMALIQFDSIENAVQALIKLHNYKVAEHSHLRVSFSKSPV